jgi:transglutaminase/protease-like cytokinesis protein 3
VLSQEVIYPAVQLALPYACPAYFQHDLSLQSDFDIAQTRLDGLQVACIDIEVPEDVECVAEVESQTYARDPEGDLFESGEVVRDPALAQPLWLNGGQRRFFRIKGVLNGEGSRGTLKVYAGKKGLMVRAWLTLADGKTSALDNPYLLALTIPLSQFGNNPPFRFLTRHPTPHAHRHDLYIRQPQCKELRANQTYVFSVIQSPSSLSSAESTKPAKLAIQTPGGKLIKLSSRIESEDGAYESLIKCGEKGSWKGLVLGATARWCVFAEWECVVG